MVLGFQKHVKAPIGNFLLIFAMALLYSLEQYPPLRPLINFVKKRDWDVIKASYGQYWYYIRNRLHVREGCLLIDERIVIPTQLRQTVLDSLHLTYPGSAVMLDLSNHVWFPHMHRAIVQTAQNCKHCTEQGRNLKPIIGKTHSFQVEPVVEPNEEVQLDFAGSFQTN